MELSAFSGQPAYVFMAITFCWSWACWSYLALHPVQDDKGWIDGLPPDRLQLLLLLIGGLGPLVSATALRGLTKPEAAASGSTYLEHTKKTRRNRPVRYFICVALLPVIAGVLTVAASFPKGVSRQLLARFFLKQSIPQILKALAYGTAAGALEEVGWRLFALPCLLNSKSLFTSSLIIGLAEGLSHLPLAYYCVGKAWGEWFLPTFLFMGPLTFVGHSIMLTALHMAATKHLLATSLYHASLRAISVMLVPPLSGLEALQLVGIQAVVCFTVCLPVVLFEGETYWTRSPKLVRKEA